MVEYSEVVIFMVMNQKKVELKKFMTTYKMFFLIPKITILKYLCYIKETKN